MDTLYRRIGGKNDDTCYADFEAALTVMTTVVSKTHPNQCAVDYGNKATLRTTDEVKGRPGVRIESGGAEYGLLLWNELTRPAPATAAATASGDAIPKTADA